MRKIVAFLIAVTVLVSSSGVALAIHTCLPTSSKKISLFSEAGCCSNEKDACDPCGHDAKSFGTSCCSSEIVYSKIASPFLTQKSQDLVSPAVINYAFSIPANVTFSSSDLIPRPVLIPDRLLSVIRPMLI